ncbi:MAG: hypothetical protein QOI38_2191 [Sphingomonadales bacterium]|jgi:hypothetical protein|nr:hypothetical protein [Sphingomonadales bacterium]
MRHRKKLLAGGVAAILLVALGPPALRSWQERRAEAERAEYIATKEREIACLERLAAGGLGKGADVQAAIERCRREAAAGGSASGP